MRSSGLHEGEALIVSKLAKAWERVIASHMMVVCAFARKGPFKSPKACADFIMEKKQVESCWVTEITHNDQPIHDLEAIKEKYGNPNKVAVEVIGRRYFLKMTFSTPRFNFGKPVIKKAAEFVAMAQMFGGEITCLLRRKFSDLKDQWIADANDWDWVTRKNGDLCMFPFWRKANNLQTLSANKREESRLVMIAECHEKQLYFMKGIGLLMKASFNHYDYMVSGHVIEDETPIITKIPVRDKDGWIKAGQQIRALDVALAIIEEREFDHSGQIGSLYEVAETGNWASVGHIKKESDGLMEKMLNSTVPGIGTARDDLVYDGPKDTIHDRDVFMAESREAMLKDRSMRGYRIVKVAVLSRFLYFLGVLMQDVMPDDRLAGLQKFGRQPPYLSKIFDNNFRLDHGITTMFDQFVDDRTGFEVFVHRYIDNPEFWLPQATSFMDQKMTQICHQTNDWVESVSKRFTMPYGEGRWVVIRYPNGYRTMNLVFDINLWHKAFGFIPDDWAFIAIQVVGEVADDVARSLGYRVRFFKRKNKIFSKWVK